MLKKLYFIRKAQESSANLSDEIQAMLKEKDLCKSTLFSYKN